MPNLSIAAVMTVISMIGQLILDMTNNANVASAVNALEAWVPIIGNAFPELLTQVEDLIATLGGSSTLTADQITQLENSRTAIEAARAAANAGTP